MIKFSLSILFITLVGLDANANFCTTLFKYNYRYFQIDGKKINVPETNDLYGFTFGDIKTLHDALAILDITSYVVKTEKDAILVLFILTKEELSRLKRELQVDDHSFSYELIHQVDYNKLVLNGFKLETNLSTDLSTENVLKNEGPSISLSTAQTMLSPKIISTTPAFPDLTPTPGRKIAYLFRFESTTHVELLIAKLNENKITYTVVSRDTEIVIQININPIDAARKFIKIPGFIGFTPANLSAINN